MDNRELKRIAKTIEKQRIQAEKEYNIKKYRQFANSDSSIEYNYYTDELQLYRNECAFILALIESDRLDDDNLLSTL